MKREIELGALSKCGHTYTRNDDVGRVWEDIIVVPGDKTVCVRRRDDVPRALVSKRQRLGRTEEILHPVQDAR